MRCSVALRAAAAAALLRAADALAPSRVVAIGDVHGDLAAMQSCLRVAGLVDASNAWAGGDARLVSCGDVLDRGDEDWECLEYLHGLRADARLARGDVHLVLGNHEVLNVLGDVRFVSRAACFAAAAACEPDRVKTSRDLEWAIKARERAFAPGGGRGAAMLADLCGDAPVALGAGTKLETRGVFDHRESPPVPLDVDGSWTSRGTAAAATWIFRGGHDAAPGSGGESRRRRGRGVDIPASRGDAAAATWIFQGRPDIQRSS